VPEPTVSYVPRADATPTAELNALANIYRLIVDRNVQQDAPGVSSTKGDDAKERSESDSSARSNIHD